MNPMPPFSERLRELFRPTSGGVIGLADGLLDLGRTHGLRIEYIDGHCVARQKEDDRDQTIMPFRKSIFRAALARIGTLCDERMPESATPYGGECDLPSDGVPPMLLRVNFTNTPAEQWLEAHLVMAPAPFAGAFVPESAKLPHDIART